ncbi:PREDICTED: uncharacterized protein LOC109588862 [Amphimedon queenslandica]|uniref:Uncharacterized protein n=1 Tax=Amphimedon queenslandica TaxID=400682 RepID=A0A1X7VVV5_AMPQE|nr:PREDICTED: uncharacterized protein LOC109588862 [Amphimedon queenslandica]|eukprot:XP_019860548.1 PREDICTED: uncharacterized protein LOC109588862 [Amphimedon queenslandica]
MASSSQRQKKRNAQMKRKKYDHKHQASGGSSHSKSEVAFEDETESKDIERIVISQPKQKEPKELEPQPVAVQDLYDMPTESSDVAMEELEGRLSQLLSSRLPSHQSLPVMQEEDTSDSQSQTESYAPSINLSGLVSCLASLPLHRKLFIPKELVELYEKGRPNHENEIMSPAPSTHPPAHSHPNQPEIIKLNKQPSSLPASSGIPEERSVLDTELNDLLQRDTGSLLTKESAKDKIAVKEKNVTVHQNTELDTALDELLDM